LLGTIADELVRQLRIPVVMVPAIAVARNVTARSAVLPADL
jgi:hypothetical protein